MTNRSRVRLSPSDTLVEPRIMLCGASPDAGGQSFANQGAPTAAPNVSAASMPTDTSGIGSEQVATQGAAPAQGLPAEGCDANAVAPTNPQVPDAAQLAEADPCATEEAMAADGAVANAALPADANSVATSPGVPGGDVCGAGQVGPMGSIDPSQQSAVAGTQQAGNQSSQPTRAELQAISQTNQGNQGASLAANSSSSSSTSASQPATEINAPQPSRGVGTRPFGQTASSSGAGPSSLS